MRKRRVVSLLLLAILSSLPSPGRAIVAVPYQRLLRQRSQDPTYWSRIGRMINWTSNPYSRSFAVVAGVWSYKFGDKLVMAENDVNKLVDYLQQYESFDEIAVLTNDDFNDATLRYFLQVYFPEQLAANPGSRFLFAFSGHGSTRLLGDRPAGYLLFSSATSPKDFSAAISIDQLMAFSKQVAGAHHTLFLLNSCFSGLAIETAGNFDLTDNLDNLLREPAFQVLLRPA